MPLNKSIGEMYPWVDATINFVKGKCYHNCSYCYYQSNPRFKSSIKNIRLDSKELKVDLGKGKTIFVGSSTDMFAKNVPSAWIEKVLEYCRKFDNTYLFQSKNPARFLEFIDQFPKKIILGTTIESNRDYTLSDAPKTNERMEDMLEVKLHHNIQLMISIEPIVDLDPDIMIAWIKSLSPIFISIGADSKKHKLPEPIPYKLGYFIKELKKITKVKLKANLKRLL